MATLPSKSDVYDDELKRVKAELAELKQRFGLDIQEAASSLQN